MRKLFTVVTSICMVMAVSAQHAGGGGTRLVVVRPSIGLGYGYSPFLFALWLLPIRLSLCDNGNHRESKLDMKVDDIKADYKDEIKFAKHDTSISKDERKKIVKQLKADRDRNIHDLKTIIIKEKPRGLLKTAGTMVDGV